jgi:hypothetical protein
MAYNDDGNMSNVLHDIVTVGFESLIDTTGLFDKSSQSHKTGEKPPLRAISSRSGCGPLAAMPARILLAN